MSLVLVFSLLASEVGSFKPTLMRSCKCLSLVARSVRLREVLGHSFRSCFTLRLLFVEHLRLCLFCTTWSSASTHPVIRQKVFHLSFSLRYVEVRRCPRVCAMGTSSASGNAVSSSPALLSSLSLLESGSLSSTALVLVPTLSIVTLAPT